MCVVHTGNFGHHTSLSRLLLDDVISYHDSWVCAWGPYRPEIGGMVNIMIFSPNVTTNRLEDCPQSRTVMALQNKLNPEAAMGVLCNCLLGALPLTLPGYVIRSFPLVRSKGCSPRTNDLTRQPTVTDRQKQSIPEGQHCIALNSWYVMNWLPKVCPDV